MGGDTGKWPTFMTKLRHRENIVDGTASFRFEKPEEFSFIAGQFVDIELLSSRGIDTTGNTRAFSISSAPCEGDLMVTTQLRNTAFKKSLGTMPLGTEVRMEGPFGDFRLHSAVERAAVFLTGGIGITPVRSILIDALCRKLPHQIFLFFSNRCPEDAPFLNELQTMQMQNPNYHFIGTMTEIEQSRTSWKGELGRIDRALLDKYLGGAYSPIYYVSGQPDLVDSLHDILREARVEDEDIRIEEFAGY